MREEVCELKKSIVVIPTYNPDQKFIPYVEELIAAGIATIIIVDDGSSEETQHIFRKLEAVSACTLLIHEENRGKGAGLKTAFRHIQATFVEETAIVTADADGQHAVQDVVRLLEELKKEAHGIVLGVRDFDLEHVPRKNAFGNKLTSRVFKWLFGTYISDTQTGLRGFHSLDIPWLVAIKGERFEYEMNMLMVAVHDDMQLVEVPIQTLYFGEERVTHYKTFRDSGRIAKQLFVGLTMKKRLVEHN